MASKALPNQFAFSAGELGPALANRSDQARYAYGAKRMQNFIPMLQGPARKRPGTRFTAMRPSGFTWLVPAVFSQGDAWVLEFRDEALRFYTDDGQVLEAAFTPASMTNASPGVFTKTSHGLSVGQEIVVSSLPGTTGIAGRNFYVNSVPTADTFTLKDLWGAALDTTSSGTYTGSGSMARVYEIASPYDVLDLLGEDSTFQMSHVLSGDVLYICVPGYRPKKLTRSGATSWAFSDVTFVGGPFEAVDPDQTITVYAAAGSGATTLTASSGIFQAGHVGSLFLLEQKLTAVATETAWEPGKTISGANQVRRSQGHYYFSGGAGTTGTVAPSHTEGARYDGDAGVLWTYIHSGYGWGLITAYNSATSVDFTVLSAIPAGAVGSGNATTRWAFGAWNDVAGWPTSVAGFFRERLPFARGTKIWMSVPLDFENFSQRDAGIVADDSAIAIDIRRGRNDDILWMIPQSDLIVGTQAGEFAVSEISTADPLSPTNIAALPGPGFSCRRTRPVTVNDALLYVPRAGTSLRELQFSLEADGYRSLNRTAFAEHIARGGIQELSYAHEPESIVWADCRTSQLASPPPADFIGMTIEHEHNFFAWHKHGFGGALAGAPGYPQVFGHCVIPAADGKRDELWLAITRTVNGVDVVHIERLAAHWDPEVDADADMFYVDCGLTYSGAATSTLSGLDHLEGESVQVWGDARYLGEFEVADGAIDLGEASVTKAQVGLKYTAVLESMALGRVGALTRIVRAVVRFIGSIYARFGPSEASVKPITFNARDLSGLVAAFTGWKHAEFDGGRDKADVTWTFVHDWPTACTVAGVVPEAAQSSERAG